MRLVSPGQLASNEITLLGVILRKRRALMVLGREDKFMKIEIEYCGQ